jgi:hypothetical protein
VVVICCLVISEEDSVVGLGDSLVISEETSVVSFGGGLILPERDQCRGDWKQAGPLRRGQCREGGCRL